MLTDTQIKSRELIIEQIEKLIEKNNKKAIKEREKLSNIYITYKGEKYYSEDDLFEAYANDIFSSTVHDRLLEKLNNAHEMSKAEGYTPTELLIKDLRSIQSNFITELNDDKSEKEKVEQIDTKMKELISEGYSYAEATKILSN